MTSHKEQPAMDTSAGKPAITGPELWEILFEIFKGDVPRALTDERLEEIASALHQALATYQQPVGDEEVEKISAELAMSAKESSRIRKMMADNKSVRNGGQPGDYLWPTPEQTTEGRALALTGRFSTQLRDAQARGKGMEEATPAARDVLAERKRQIEVEGWTPEHDDRHAAGEMALAASAYAYETAATPGYSDNARPYLRPVWWPWHQSWFKPGTRRRNLVKAGALILAEIERLDRAALSRPEGSAT